MEVKEGQIQLCNHFSSSSITRAAHPPTPKTPFSAPNGWPFTLTSPLRDLVPSLPGVGWGVRNCIQGEQGEIVREFMFLWAPQTYRVIHGPCGGDRLMGASWASLHPSLTQGHPESSITGRPGEKGIPPSADKLLTAAGLLHVLAGTV